jgi:hypothetical protein
MLQKLRNVNDNTKKKTTKDSFVAKRKLKWES